MQDPRPQNLSDTELVHYAELLGYDNLSSDWTAELAKRLDARITADELENTHP